MLPLEMPITGAALQSFEPQRVDFISPEAGGRVGAVTAGNPLWLGTWQIGKIGAARSDLWRSFMLRLRGSQRTFYGRDIARPFPLTRLRGFTGLTRAGGGSFDGSATSWSQAIDADGEAMLTLAGLPAGLALSLGDYIGLRWGTGAARRTMARVVAPAIASSAGQLSVLIEPPIPTLVVPAGAVAHLDNPACVMRLVPGESEMGPIDRRLAITSGKIAGVQDLRA